jgi:hypothetical protein
MPRAPFALYFLNAKLEALFERIDEATSPIPDDEIVAAIKAINEDQTGLFEDLRKGILNEAGKAKAAKEEADRLYAIAQSYESKADRLKAFVLEAMQGAGLQKVEFPTGGHIRIQKNSAPAVVLEIEAEKLPPLYRKEKVEYSVDREAVLGAKEMGLKLPDGVSVVHGSHVRLN